MLCRSRRRRRGRQPALKPSLPFKGCVSQRGAPYCRTEHAASTRVTFSSYPGSVKLRRFQVIARQVRWFHLWRALLQKAPAGCKRCLVTIRRSLPLSSHIASVFVFLWMLTICQLQHEVLCRANPGSPEFSRRMKRDVALFAAIATSASFTADMIGVFGSFIANNEKRVKEAWHGKGRNRACRAVGHCRTDACARRACENVVITWGGLATGTVMRFKLWVYCAATRGTYGVRVSAVRHLCLCQWSSARPSLYCIKISCQPNLKRFSCQHLGKQLSHQP